MEEAASTQQRQREAAARLRQLVARARALGAEAATRPAGRRLLADRCQPQASGAPPSSPLALTLAGAACASLALLLALGLHTHGGFARAWLKWQRLDIYDEACTIQAPDIMTKVFRPPENCSMCVGVHHVEKVDNISPAVFEEKYAYTGKPVVVTDAMENWTAPEVFDFEFFKSIYDERNVRGCQFFPYETEFKRLEEVFDMSEDRAKMRDGTKPWYVGWSNCDDRIARILREHYTRPYFLPPTAENKNTDWIFIGSPGYGAHMHVDNVGHPSWQAQLRGSKKWTLQPPPECFYCCDPLQVVVEPGEIIILDTNRWYHKTLIVSNEMSITIGAEYD
ncbi:uncharacterized protein LOC126470740 [Schistocerca serialis cubense]|uniref:uncharacterized protein LOC126470740 n=1 Tax=Schistocerca serialis cubense TaxID=2023355 RepID=UPI00214EDF89|nr:uncharacterized protein LOC126470740 [Schistocerca serialis cubense]